MAKIDFLVEGTFLVYTQTNIIVSITTQLMVVPTSSVPFAVHEL